MGDLYVKGLNTAGGDNVFRFRGEAERTAAASSGIARRVRADHERSAAPSQGEQSSFFKDELDRWRELDISGDFKRLNYKLAPISRTLAQVIHHKNEIIDALLGCLHDKQCLCWKPAMHLVGVLARDLQHDMFERFDDVVSVLRTRIDPTAPEATAETFRTVSFVFKYLSESILADSKYSVRFNEWIAYLGSNKVFIRELTASSLSLLLKQHSDSGLKNQVSSLLRGMSTVQDPPLAGLASVDDINDAVTTASQTASRARSTELKDGLSMLLFELLRGANKLLHSKAPKVMTAMLHSFAPKASRLAELATAAVGAGAAGASAAKTELNSARLNANSARLNAAAGLYQLTLSQRYEVVAQSLRYVVGYCSLEGGEVVWHAIHDAIEEGMKAFTESDIALQKAEKNASSPDNSSKIAVLQATITAQALYLGQLAGLLASWVSFGKGSKIPRDSSRLTETLRRLLTNRLWASPLQSGLARLLTLRLLSVSWKHVCVYNPAGAARRAGGVGRGKGKFGRRGGADKAGRKRPRSSNDDDDADDDEDDELQGVDIDLDDLEDDGIAVVKRKKGGDNGEAGRLASKFLDAVFALPPAQRQADINHVAQATSAAAAGILLAQQTEEGPVYPNVAIAGSGAMKRVIHVGSLAAQSMVLSFARELLVLASNPEFSAAAADSDDDDGVLAVSSQILKSLLPHLGSYLLPLLSSSSTDRTGGRDVVWSILLTARDAVLPRGSHAGVSGLVQAIPGLLTSTGRLILGAPREDDELARKPSKKAASVADTVANLLLAELSGVPSIITSTMARLAADEIDDEDALKVLTSAYAAVSSAAAVQIPPVAAAKALLAIALAAVPSQPLASASKPAALLHHIRAMAVLNIARTLRDAGDQEAAVAELVSALPVFTSIFGWTGASVAALANATGSFSLGGDEASAAIALANLNAGAEYVESLRGAGGKPIDKLLSSARGREVATWLQPVLSHRDHSLRLSALRILCGFRSEAFLDAGSEVPISVTLPALPSSDAAGAAGDASKRSVQVLSDVGLRSDSESILEGDAPTLQLLLHAEALPNTLTNERNKASTLQKLAVLVSSKRLPPLHVTCAVQHALGLLYAKFQPLWKPAQGVLVAAATAYPRTTWALFGKQLYFACIDRPALRDTSGDVEKPRFEGQTRSQSRSDRANAGIVSLRIGAMAVAAATGRNPEAMSLAGTVVSQAATEAGAGGDPHATDAALEAGYPELEHRVATVLSVGLYGADAGAPAVVADAVADVTAASTAAAARVRAELSHTNDSLPLGMGEGGFADSETAHKSLLSVLQSAPLFAEARSRTLVPLFLSFMRDDFYGKTHNDDPDAAELSLDTELTALLAQYKESQAKQAAKKASKQAAITDSSSPQAVEGGREVANDAFSRDTEALLERLVSGRELQSQAGRLPRTAASARLMSFLRLFEQFDNWQAIFGGAVLRRLLLRLLTRLEGGTGEAALKVLISMRLPYLLPYKDNMLRLVSDHYREEMTLFQVAPQSSPILSEHRVDLLPILLRLMYGRVLQRKGRSARDTPAARRATALGYMGSLAPSEIQFVIYMAARPFLLAKSTISGNGGMDTASALTSTAQPKTAESALAAVDGIAASFAPVDGPDAQAKRFVTAPRAVGFLHLVRDLVKQLRANLEPHLHHLLAIVVACLRETRVRRCAAADDDVAMDDGIVDDDDAAANKSGKAAGGKAKDDDDAASRDADDFEDDDAGHHAAGALAPSGASSTSLAHKARDIRTLAVQRIADILTAFPGYDYAPWIPLLQECLGDAVSMLPKAMVHASRPSALLHLFVTCSNNPELMPMLSILPSIIPAVCACLSAGMAGSASAFAEHTSALSSTDDATAVDNGAASSSAAATSESSDASGPSQAVLTQAFAFVENLLGVQEGPVSAAGVIARMQPHLPFLLRHLCIRLAASTVKPAADAAGSSSSAADGVTAGVMEEKEGMGIIVPKLKGGVKIFARRQLAILARVSEIVEAVTKVNSGSVGGGASAPTVQQLVLLLLPYLRNRKPASARPAMQEDDSDPVLLVLKIVQRLVPLLNDPQPYLPFFSQLLAPGLKAVTGPPRQALIAVIEGMCAHASLAHLKPAMELLSKLAARNVKRIAELDYDTVLYALEEISKASFHAMLFDVAPSSSASAADSHMLSLARALPALLHQCSFHMLDTDMAVRTAALNTLTSIIKAAAHRALTQWKDVDAAAYLQRATAAAAAGKSAADVIELESIPGITAKASSSDVAVYAIVRIIIPDIRSSMQTVSPTMRRGFISLLSDVVGEFQSYGSVQVPLPLTDASAPDAPAASKDKTTSVRVVIYPDLHPDLAVLINRTDLEADGFLNLMHVQLHRRARALTRLAYLTDQGSFTLHSLKEFILPMTLHALYDEAGGGVGAEIVESKGKFMKVKSQSAGGSNPGQASGLHAEAVKCIGAIARALPWSLYSNTMKRLMRLAGTSPSIEKVLVRAVAAMADAFHFDVSVPRVTGEDTAKLQVNEREFMAQLVLAIDTGIAVGTGKAKATVDTSDVADAAATADGVDADVDEANADMVDVDDDADAEEATKKRKPKRRKSKKDDDGADEDVDGDDDDEKAQEADEAADAGDDLVGEEEDDEDAVAAPTRGTIIGSASVLSPEVEAELERRTVLLSLCTSLIPALRKLLHKAASAKEKPGKIYESGELRPPIAMALTRLYGMLPRPVTDAEVPGLLADLCNSLRSRRQEFRETARATLAKVAAVLGPVRLDAVLRELKDALVEGYQVHIMGHALFAVVEALAPSMIPSQPALPANAAGAAEADAASSSPVVDDAGTSIAEAKPGSSYLAKSLPMLLGMVMEDVMGEAAEARDEASGYKPKAQLAEAKKCRSYETMEVVSRCIPFLPDPAIHTLTAPLIAALEDDRRAGRTSEVVDVLFKRVLAGLAANPSVTGPYLLLYVHGICSEFLHVSAQSAAQTVMAEIASAAAAESSASGAGGAGAKSSSSSAPVPLSIADAYAKFAKFLKPRGVGKMKPIVSWLVHDKTAAEEAPEGHLKLDGSRLHQKQQDSAVPLTGAMRLKGSGVVATHGEALYLLPEPKMTGTGRYISTGKATRNSGAASAADVPIGCFALSMLHAGLQKGRVTSTNKLHTEMLDPYVPLLLRLLEACKENKVTTLALRILSVLLPYPLPMLRKVGIKLGRAILATVEATSGGSGAARDAQSSRSEVAQSALKAATVMVRACDYIRVSDDQLRALLMIVRKDLHISARQNAVFALLKSIVGRRLVTSEVYDVMDDVAKLLVTSLRPTARASCASVFLQFLLRYPMAEKRLSSHLEFFVRNLGYAIEDGRIAVLDMLLAIISKFPTPVLDEYSSFLLLPLTVRLSIDPSLTCRAMVGSLIRALFKYTSMKGAKELIAMVLQWMKPGQKAGNRRSAAQVIGLASEGRPEAVAAVMPGALAAMTSELAKAAVDVALMEAKLAEDAETEESAASSAAAHLAEQGDERNEEEERHAGRQAAKRAQAIQSGDADAAAAAAAPKAVILADGVEDSDAEEEDEVAAADEPKSRSVPVGNAGGGAIVFGQPSSSSADASASAGSQPEGVVVPIVWEPAYHTLLAAEKLLKAAGDKVDVALASAESAELASESVDLYAATPEGWTPMVDDASGQNIIAAASNLLLYPHAWVRLAASRLLGLFLSRRAVERFQQAADTTAASAQTSDADVDVDEDVDAVDEEGDEAGGDGSGDEEADEESDDDEASGDDDADDDAGEQELEHSNAAAAAEASNAALRSSMRDVDGAAVWMASERVLTTLALRTCSQLASRHLGTHLADQAAKNLVFLSLSLHAIVAPERRNDLDPLVAEGHQADAATSASASSAAAAEGAMDEGADDEGNAAGGAAESEQREMKRDPVFSIFARACNVARFHGDAAKSAVLKWIAAVSMRLPRDEMLRYIVPPAKLLYRLTSMDLPDHEISPATRALASEAVELLQGQVGTHAFLRVYNQERARVASVRISRKRDRAMLKVVDPEAAALAKSKKSAVKYRQKKRKIEGFKAAKGKPTIGGAGAGSSKGKSGSSSHGHGPSSHRSGGGGRGRGGGGGRGRGGGGRGGSRGGRGGSRGGGHRR